ncbi:MAG: signal peptidase I [Patescibacteria group bacterium]|nr:signal peptidase I [Patescibacteria group bacterium]
MKKKDSIWELIELLILVLVIVIPIRMFIAQPFLVSGESMLPTFHDKEFLIVDELSYLTGEPERGDIAIFKYPVNKKRIFIKRIIGIPGDTITISNGNVFIDGEKINEPYIKEQFITNGTYEVTAENYFVMGDNRNRSSDSRIWGLVPENYLIGRAYIRLLPLSEISYLPGKYNYGQETK